MLLQSRVPRVQPVLLLLRLFQQCHNSLVLLKMIFLVSNEVSTLFTLGHIASSLS